MTNKDFRNMVAEYINANVINTKVAAEIWGYVGYNYTKQIAKFTAKVAEFKVIDCAKKSTTWFENAGAAEGVTQCVCRVILYGYKDKEKALFNDKYCNMYFTLENFGSRDYIGTCGSIYWDCPNAPENAEISAVYDTYMQHAENMDKAFAEQQKAEAEAKAAEAAVKKAAEAEAAVIAAIPADLWQEIASACYEAEQAAAAVVGKDLAYCSDTFISLFALSSIGSAKYIEAEKAKAEAVQAEHEAEAEAKKAAEAEAAEQNIFINFHPLMQQASLHDKPINKGNIIEHGIINAVGSADVSVLVAPAFDCMPLQFWAIMKPADKATKAADIVAKIDGKKYCIYIA